MFYQRRHWEMTRTWYFRMPYFRRIGIYYRLVSGGPENEYSLPKGIVHRSELSTLSRIGDLRNQKWRRRKRKCQTEPDQEPISRVRTTVNMSMRTQDDVFLASRRRSAKNTHLAAMNIPKDCAAAWSAVAHTIITAPMRIVGRRPNPSAKYGATG